MRLRALTATVLAAVTALSLSSCGSSDAASDPNAPIRVGVSPVPHGEILRYVADNLAQDKGIKVEVVEINDYVTPNTALADRSLEANYFQHKPYLEKFEAEKGVQLSWVGPVHLEPLAAFSKKVKSLKDLPNGAKVAVPNDPTNEARALTLLAGNGVLELKPGTEKTATKQDVAANPKNVEIVELEAAQVPRSLDDVDAAVINGNYALQADLNPTKDAIAIESAEGNPYANGLVTRPELAGDERITKLQELLTSPQVREYVEQTFKGSVIPAKG
ncbi:lipoprotein [Longimycelium tulufanense]|uniref:Lipoprotein n=1 Tax=Longimycelium tulufanense TaxID=907463 RepID=A0A8J3FYS6_9PSEU|nr:MetQ/NlpA family ABC transporter substrate-binding protein [Longimycelium tulufanense]GGM74459.1 lipoprotein [Longimycelium tulufanense]